MKKLKAIFLDFPFIEEIKFKDSGESIICKTKNGGTFMCTTLKELRRELKKGY